MRMILAFCVAMIALSSPLRAEEANSSPRLFILSQASQEVMNKAIGPVTVEAFDAFTLGHINDNATKVTISLASGPGQLQGTLTKPMVNGAVKFTDLMVTAPGSGYQFLISAAGYPPIKTLPFTVHAYGSPRQLSFSIEPSKDWFSGYDAVFSTQPVVAVLDGYGNLIADDNASAVTLKCVDPQGCMLLGTATVPVVNGHAVFTNLHLNAGVTGPVTLEAISSQQLIATDSTAF